MSCVVVLFLLSCSLSCLVEGIEAIQTSKSCHQEDPDSETQFTKLCCKQAVVKEAIPVPYISSVLLLEIQTAEPLLRAHDRTDSVPSMASPPGIYQLRSLRI